MSILCLKIFSWSQKFVTFNQRKTLIKQKASKFQLWSKQTSSANFEIVLFCCISVKPFSSFNFSEVYFLNLFSASKGLIRIVFPSLFTNEIGKHDCNFIVTWDFIFKVIVVLGHISHNTQSIWYLHRYHVLCIK